MLSPAPNLACRVQVKLTPGLPAHWGLLKQRLEKVCLGSA